MTEHEQYQDDFKAYLDNELPLSRRIAVRRHVDGCRACREELMQMAQVTEELRADEARETGSTPSIDPSLKNKIIGDYTPTPSFNRPATKRSKLIERFALAACLSLVVAVGSVKFLGSTAGNKLNTVSSNISNDEETEQPQAASAIPLTIKQQAMDRLQPNRDDERVPNQYAFANRVGKVADDAQFDRRVHKEASITVEVDDPEAKGDEIETKVKGAGGFVASNNLSTGDGNIKTAEITVKVPVGQFEDMLGQISHLGDVKAKNVTGEDITEKVSDAGQQENVLEDEVNKANARLTELGRKSKWDDAETARDLRIQLAQSRARLVLLKKLGELSDIDITLTQKAKPQPAPSSGFVSGMSDSTHSALGSMVGAVSALLTLLIWIVVYAPIWIPLGLAGRWIYRRYWPAEGKATV